MAGTDDKRDESYTRLLKRIKINLKATQAAVGSVSSGLNDSLNGLEEMFDAAVGKWNAYRASVPGIKDDLLPPELLGFTEEDTDWAKCVKTYFLTGTIQLVEDLGQKLLSEKDKYLPDLKTNPKPSQVGLLYCWGHQAFDSGPSADLVFGNEKAVLEARQFAAAALRPVRALDQYVEFYKSYFAEITKNLDPGSLDDAGKEQLKALFNQYKLGSALGSVKGLSKGWVLADEVPAVGLCLQSLLDTCDDGEEDKNAYLKNNAKKTLEASIQGAIDRSAALAALFPDGAAADLAADLLAEDGLKDKDKMNTAFAKWLKIGPEKTVSAALNKYKADLKAAIDNLPLYQDSSLIDADAVTAKIESAPPVGTTELSDAGSFEEALENTLQNLQIYYKDLEEHMKSANKTLTTLHTSIKTFSDTVKGLPLAFATLLAPDQLKKALANTPANGFKESEFYKNLVGEVGKYTQISELLKLINKNPGSSE